MLLFLQPTVTSFGMCSATPLNQPSSCPVHRSVKSLCVTVFVGVCEWHVCVCVCERERERVCACVCVHACLSVLHMCMCVGVCSCNCVCHVGKKNYMYKWIQKIKTFSFIKKKYDLVFEAVLLK